MQPESECPTPLEAFPLRVKTRVASASYGTCTTCTWDAMPHEEADRYFDEFSQTFRVDNQMTWFIEQVCETTYLSIKPTSWNNGFLRHRTDVAQGEDIPTDIDIQYHFFASYSNPYEVSEVTDSVIYHTRAFPSPTTPTPEMSELCRIKWDPNEVDIDRLVRRTNPRGDVCYELDWEVHATCSNESLDFSAYYLDSKIASKKVTVDFGTRQDAQPWLGILSSPSRSGNNSSDRSLFAVAKTC